MKKNILTPLMVCAVMMSFVIAGCGSSGSQNTPAASKATLSGVASLDTTVNGTVSVKDSSVPAQEMTVPINGTGTYTVDVSGLKPPFILKAEGTDQAGNGQTMYSISKNGGRVNINPLSDTAVTASSDNTDWSAHSSMRSSEDEHHRTADNFEQVIYRLRTVLAPLYSLYHISGNAVTDDDDNDNSGLSAMLHDVRFAVNDGKVTVTNRLTGGVIFSGSLRDLASGTFNPANMPGGTGGSTACAYTYDAWSACTSNGTQTRNLLTSSPAGCTGTPVLTQPCTYVPPTPSACTYAYGAWGACLSTGTQVRSLVSSVSRRLHRDSHPDTTLHTARAADVHILYLQRIWDVPVQQHSDQEPSDLVSRRLHRRNAGPVPGLHLCTAGNDLHILYLQRIWSVPVQQHADQEPPTSSPAGCTGGTPVLSQACTYVPPVTTCTSFTYSAFGACQSNNTQTRSLLTSSPAGCTGGTPVLSQACTYVPPVTTCTSFTYSACGACQSNNTQTRNLLTSSPAGCTGGTPVLSQACTYVPPVTTCTSFTYSAFGSVPVQQHADQEPCDLVSRRLHRRNAGPVPGLHLCSADAGMRLLPRHPAGDWPARFPRELARVRSAAHATARATVQLP